MLKHFKLFASAFLIVIFCFLGTSLSNQAHAQNNSNPPKAVATGTITIGSQIFPIVPHIPTTIKHVSPRLPNKLNLSAAPAYANCSRNGGGYWQDIGDASSSGGGYHAYAIVYGLYDSPFSDANFCGETYCYGQAAGDPHTAPINDGLFLDCYGSNASWPDNYACPLPSGGLNGSTCGMDSQTYYNSPWGQAREVIPYKTIADTYQRWG